MSRPLVVVLLALLSFPALADDDLYFSIEPRGETLVDPGSLVVYRATVRNLRGDAARDVTMTIPLPPGQLVSVRPETEEWRCTSSASEVVCHRDSLPLGDYLTTKGVEIRVAVPEDRLGLFFIGEAKATAAPPKTFSQSTAGVVAVVFAHFPVTSTADSGPGTLRAVIEESNPHCQGRIPCKILIDVPRFSTIEPLTPLPAITSCSIFMLGNGTRNGDRRVELSGARLETGSGLELRSTCDGQVRIEDIAINRFPDFGILMLPSTYSVWLRGVFIGTDVTGREARPNHRGIGGFFERGRIEIDNSIISGNRRAGVFAWNARVAVMSSLVGVSSDDLPLGNGASGIFSGLGWPYITSTVIAYNGEFGLAVSRDVEDVTFSGGSMHSNGITGIDWGLDGPSLRGEDGRIPPPPTITDAYYDAEKKVTVVTGTFPEKSVIGPLRGVQVYASRALNASGNAEGEQYVGSTAFIESAGDGLWRFRFEVGLDLRGQIVTATVGSAKWLDAPLGRTTEFSAGLTVR